VIAVEEAVVVCLDNLVIDVGWICQRARENIVSQAVVVLVAERARAPQDSQTPRGLGSIALDMSLKKVRPSSGNARCSYFGRRLA